MPRLLIVSVVLFSSVAGAVTFGNRNPNQGLFNPNQSGTTFGTQTGTAPRAPASAPREAVAEAVNAGNVLKEYGSNLSKSDNASLVQLQKAAKQAGTSLGVITAREHIALSQCLFPRDDAPDTTPAMAAKCMDRAAQERNQQLLSFRFPEYVNKMNPPPTAKPSPH